MVSLTIWSCSCLEGETVVSAALDVPGGQAMRALGADATDHEPGQAWDFRGDEATKPPWRENVVAPGMTTVAAALALFSLWDRCGVDAGVHTGTLDWEAWRGPALGARPEWWVGDGVGGMGVGVGVGGIVSASRAVGSGYRKR